MHEWESLSHVRWECKYHVVFIPKYRRKVLYGPLRRQIGPILRELCRQKGVELLERHRFTFAAENAYRVLRCTPLRIWVDWVILSANMELFIGQSGGIWLGGRDSISTTGESAGPGRPSHADARTQTRRA